MNRSAIANLRKLQLASRKHLNCVRFGKNESIKHAMKKAEVCYRLNEAGYSFVTEAKFENGKRADIYVLEDDTAIEIVNTEKEKSIAKKKQAYPCNVVVMRIDEKSYVEG